MICGMTSMPDISTPSKRANLPPSSKPYFVAVAGQRGGVSLGYRKPRRGTGAWIAKLALEGRRAEASIAQADDIGAGPEAVGYRKALSAAIEWAQQRKALHDATPAGAPAPIRTVASAVKSYIEKRARKPAGAKDAESRLTLHVLSDETFAARLLSKLRSEHFDEWRAGLSAGLAASTINRLLNDVRAALNDAAERYRRELPGTLALEIKIGTRAIPAATVARMQLLEDAEIQRLLDAARQIDGELYLLLMTLATTGARFSQVAAIRVCDLQPAAGRIMVPRSGKGSAQKTRTTIPVPLPSVAVAELTRAGAGRKLMEALLLTGEYERCEPGARISWRRIGTRPWRTAADGKRRWDRAIKAAALPPDTVPYALRHSSIVRQLKAGTPIRIVAALHDTSVAMIESHYSAWINDVTEDIARKGMINI